MSNIHDIIKYINGIYLYLTPDLIIKDISKPLKDLYRQKIDFLNKNYIEICDEYGFQNFLPEVEDIYSIENEYKYQKKIKKIYDFVEFDCSLLKVTDEGKFSGFLIVAKQINHDDEVNEIKNYYENLISHMPGNVYWLDRNFITLGCNNNVLDLVGLDRKEDFIGITYEEMGKLAGWEEGQAESFKKDDMKVMSSGQSIYNVEEPPLYDNNGNPIYYLSSRVPLKNKNDEIIGVVGISVNVTDYKNLLRKLEDEKNKTEKAYASMLSLLSDAMHRLKTPFNEIKLLKEVIESNKIILDDKLLDYFYGLTEDAQRCNEYLDKARELVLLQLHPFVNEPKPFDFKYFSKTFFSILTSKVGVNLKYNISNNVPSCISLDKKQLTKILSIFVKNAIRFTNEGVIEVKFDAQKKDNNLFLEITVSDTGLGISESQQKNSLFEYAFYEIKDNHNIEYKLGNSNIGLALAKLIITNLNGSIKLVSEMNIGTRITFSIPYTIPSKPTYYVNYMTEEGLDGHLQKELPKNLRILLVEDEQNNRNMSRALIEKFNYTVLTAKSGEEAVKMALIHQFDVIFMDITMPGITGVEAARQIIDKLGPEVRIVALSTHAGQENNDEYFFENGMMLSIEKPLTFDTLKSFFLSL
ncbi:MAG: Sensor histidine kinase RcsC [Legionellaceae bacterium]